MHHQKGVKLDSSAKKPAAPLFYQPKPPITWRSEGVRSIRRWLTMCCGKRTPYKTSDAAVRRLEEGKKTPGDLEPLIEESEEEDEMMMELDKKKREALRETFPRHAAASMLKTGTSRAMREANHVL